MLQRTRSDAAQSPSLTRFVSLGQSGRSISGYANVNSMTRYIQRVIDQRNLPFPCIYVTETQGKRRFICFPEQEDEELGTASLLNL